MPYFICLALTGKDAKGIEVPNYKLNEWGMIQTVYQEEFWVIRDWVYVKEL
jgi:hypothetical protein